MVPDSVDERILEEHLLRDKFYNVDYTSMSSSVGSRSTSSSLHAKLGYIYDFFVFVLILLLAGAALYIVLRAIVLVRRKCQAGSTLLPFSTPVTSGTASFPSSATASPSLSTPLSSLFGNAHKEKCVGKQGTSFDKLISKMQGEERLRQD
ncbi:uncharacterized protein V1513DRAFT_431638 [Lipomyces chichibuensis]|uniref:uncharacterized protein n=1 Tax=Lipomyces chichibuensis TaxID=1546026 RepID=UPI003344084A